MSPTWIHFGIVALVIQLNVFHCYVCSSLRSHTSRKHRKQPIKMQIQTLLCGLKWNRSYYCLVQIKLQTSTNTEPQQSASSAASYNMHQLSFLWRSQPLSVSNKALFYTVVSPVLFMRHGQVWCLESVIFPSLHTKHFQSNSLLCNQGVKQHITRSTAFLRTGIDVGGGAGAPWILAGKAFHLHDL